MPELRVPGLCTTPCSPKQSSQAPAHPDEKAVEPERGSFDGRSFPRTCCMPSPYSGSYIHPSTYTISRFRIRSTFQAFNRPTGLTCRSSSSTATLCCNAARILKVPIIEASRPLALGLWSLTPGLAGWGGGGEVLGMASAQKQANSLKALRGLGAHHGHFCIRDLN